MKARALLVILVVAALAGTALWRRVGPGEGPESYALNGGTMGTTYSVKVNGRHLPPPDRLQERIDARLAEINRSMSTWDPGSEISRINKLPAGRPVKLSDGFRTVLEAAMALSRETGGAFDVTVGPLVNLWGYGPTAYRTPPSPAGLRAAEARVGYRKLALQGDTLTKRAPGMYLDFSGIAKGYGVDQVARLLRAQGIRNYLVEIGGEVDARGTNAAGKPWRVGVDRPVEGELPGQELSAVLQLGSGALATSGSYRRFKRLKHGESTHIIDPRTGRPAVSRLVSVTVYAENCMRADGIATALIVMGLHEGLAWVENHPGVEALFLEARPDGSFAHHASPGFRHLLVD